MTMKPSAFDELTLARLRYTSMEANVLLAPKGVVTRPTTTLFDAYLPPASVGKLRQDLLLRPDHYSEEERALAEKVVAGDRDHAPELLAQLLETFLRRTKESPRTPEGRRPPKSVPKEEEHPPESKPTFEAQDYGDIVLL